MPTWSLARLPGKGPGRRHWALRIQMWPKLQGRAAGIFDPAEVAVDIKPKAPRETGQAVTVRVSYELDLVAPFINAILPDPMTITGSTVMRVE